MTLREYIEIKRALARMSADEKDQLISFLRALKDSAGSEEPPSFSPAKV